MLQDSYCWRVAVSDIPAWRDNLTCGSCQYYVAITQQDGVCTCTAGNNREIEKYPVDASEEACYCYRP